MGSAPHLIRVDLARLDAADAWFSPLHLRGGPPARRLRKYALGLLLASVRSPERFAVGPVPAHL